MFPVTNPHSKVLLNPSQILELFEKQNITVYWLTKDDINAIHTRMPDQLNQLPALTPREIVLKKKLLCAFDYTIGMALSWITLKLLDKICFSSEEAIPDYAQHLKRVCVAGGLALFGLMMIRAGQSFLAHLNVKTGIYLSGEVAAGRAHAYLVNPSGIVVKSITKKPVPRQLAIPKLIPE